MPSAATLAGWIRHAKRTGLYDLGRLLYEKGALNVEKLPEEVQVGVEEDYETCTRQLARSHGGEARGKAKTKVKGGRGKG